MKLVDGLKEKGKPFEIPDCSRDELPQLFVDRGYKVGVEVGVEEGEFSEKLCRAGLQISAIDSWEKESDYEETLKRLSSYPNCKIIRKTSMEAVNEFKDKSLDFVYIDADHRFRYIAEDLYEWSKKVRSGGIVCGHDYFFPLNKRGKETWHVGYVLRAYTEAFGIENWYVLGLKNKVKGTARDKWRSWMFIKP
jgi:hypothetical protein